VIAPWIIDDIRKREREREEERQIPLELPLPYWPEPDEVSPPPDDRGVTVIDLL
jgi:hypothetical protein